MYWDRIIHKWKDVILDIYVAFSSKDVERIIYMIILILCVIFYVIIIKSIT